MYGVVILESHCTSPVASGLLKESSLMTASHDALVHAADGFRRIFGSAPTVIAAAPGRVNLIGEHTDYNDGFVFPAAIDLSIRVAARPRSDATLAAHASMFGATAQASLDALVPVREPGWMNYVAGTAAMLLAHGIRLRGTDLFIQGDIPVGAGLSSSAALEVATALALLSIADAALSPVDIALACQKAEHAFAGVHCGVMDQFISVLGKRDHALFVDCRSLSYELVPIPAGVRLVVCDTNVKRALTSSAYNERRADCAAGVAALSKHLPGITALRDISPEQLDRYGSSLPPNVRRRCRHVVTENARVQRSVAALRANDLSEFGKLMYQSHLSLKNDYEVSCPELDTIVDICAEEDEVFGARMTGAGFGGCAVCLVSAAHAERVAERLRTEYPVKTGRQPTVYVSTVEDGASVHPFRI